MKDQGTILSIQENFHIVGFRSEDQIAMVEEGETNKRSHDWCTDVPPTQSSITGKLLKFQRSL